MRIIVPLPLGGEEIKSIELLLQTQFGSDLSQLMKDAIGAWDVLDHSVEVSSSMEGGILGWIEPHMAQDFAEWFELSHRLTELTQRLGRQIFEQLDPCLQATFDNAGYTVRFMRYLPGAILLDVRSAAPLQETSNE